MDVVGISPDPQEKEEIGDGDTGITALAVEGFGCRNAMYESYTVGSPPRWRAPF